MAHLSRRFIAALLFSLASCVPFQKDVLDSTEPLGFLFVFGLMTPTPRMVAVGSNCSIWASPDGVSWTKRTSTGGCNAGEHWNAVAYASSSNTWVIVGGGTTSCRIATSDDTIVWTAQNCAPGALTQPLYAVAFGSNTFVAGGQCVNCATCASETYNIVRSGSTGTSWSLMGTAFPLSGGPLATDRVKSVVYSNSKFLLNFAACSTPPVYYSTDLGVSFTGGTAPSLATGFKMAVGPKIGVNQPRILAYGSNGSNYGAQTTDNESTTWSAFASPAPFGGTSGSVLTAVYGTQYAIGAVGVASVSAGGNPGDGFETAGSYSVNGASSASFFDSVYYDGSYYMGGTSGTIIRSSTGSAGSWTMVGPGGSDQINGMAVKQ